MAHDRNTQFEQHMEDAIGGVLHTPDLPVGQIIGSFRITRLLGHGGMGTVYLAERVSEFMINAFRLATSILELSRRISTNIQTCNARGKPCILVVRNNLV